MAGFFTDISAFIPMSEYGFLLLIPVQIYTSENHLHGSRKKGDVVYPKD